MSGFPREDEPVEHRFPASPAARSKPRPRQLGQPSVTTRDAFDFLVGETGRRGSGTIGEHRHPAPADLPRWTHLHRDAGEHLLAVVAAATWPGLLTADVRDTGDSRAEVTCVSH